MKIYNLIQVILISVLFIFGCSSTPSENKNETQSTEIQSNDETIDESDEYATSVEEDEIDKICELIDNNIDNKKLKETVITSKCTEFNSIDSLIKYTNEKGEILAVIMSSEYDDGYEWSEYYLDKNKIICAYNYYETYPDDVKIDYEEYYTYYVDGKVFSMWGKELSGTESSYDSFDNADFEEYEFDETEETTNINDTYDFIKIAKTSKDLIEWFCETE